MAKLAVIDDEVDILDVTKRFFSKRNIEVVTASEGNEAIRLISEQKPDLILLDYNLPGLSGLEILKKLREELKLNCKVIIITGFDAEKVLSETKGLNISNCIHKPLDLGKLEEIVSSFLKS